MVLSLCLGFCLSIILYAYLFFHYFYKPKSDCFSDTRIVLNRIIEHQSGTIAIIPDIGFIIMWCKFVRYPILYCIKNLKHSINIRGKIIIDCYWVESAKTMNHHYRITQFLILYNYYLFSCKQFWVWFWNKPLLVNFKSTIFIKAVHLWMKIDTKLSKAVSAFVCWFIKHWHHKACELFICKS